MAGLFRLIPVNLHMNLIQVECDLSTYYLLIFNLFCSHSAGWMPLILYRAATGSLWLVIKCRQSCRADCFRPTKSLQPVCASSTKATNWKFGSTILHAWRDLKRSGEAHLVCWDVERVYLSRSGQMLGAFHRTWVSH